MQLNLWVRGFKDGSVDHALAAFKVRSKSHNILARPIKPCPG